MPHRIEVFGGSCNLESMCYSFLKLKENNMQRPSKGAVIFVMSGAISFVQIVLYDLVIIPLSLPKLFP